MSSDEQLDRLEALLAEINASEADSDEEVESHLSARPSPKRSGGELSETALSEPSKSLEISSDKAFQESDSSTNSETRFEEAQKENDSQPVDFVRNSSEHTETKKEEAAVKSHQEITDKPSVAKDTASNASKSVGTPDSQPIDFVRDLSEHTETKKEEAAGKSHQEIMNKPSVVKDAAPDADKSVGTSDSKPTGSVRDSNEHPETEKEEAAVKSHQEITDKTLVVKDAAPNANKSVGTPDSQPIDFVRDSSEHAETKKEEAAVKSQQVITDKPPVVKGAAPNAVKSVGNSDSRPNGSVRDSNEHTKIKKEAAPVKSHQETTDKLSVVKDAAPDASKSVGTPDSRPTGSVLDSHEHTGIKKEEAAVKSHEQTTDKDAAPDADKSVGTSDSRPTGSVRDLSPHPEVKMEEAPVKSHQEPMDKDAASDASKSVETSDSRPAGSVRDSNEPTVSDATKEGASTRLHQETTDKPPLVKDAAPDANRSVGTLDSRSTGSVRDSNEPGVTATKEASTQLHQESNAEVSPAKNAPSEVEICVGNSPMKATQNKPIPGDGTPTIDSTSRSTAAEKKKQKKARQKQRAKAAKAAGLSPSPNLGSDSPLMSLDSPNLASGSPSLGSIPINISADSPDLASASVPTTSKSGTSPESGESQNAPGTENPEAESSKEECEPLAEENPRSSPHEKASFSDAENEVERERSKSEESNLVDLQQANHGLDTNHSGRGEEKTLASTESLETGSGGGSPKAVLSIPDSLGISSPASPNKSLHSEEPEPVGSPSGNAETRENVTSQDASVSQSQTLKDEPELAETPLEKLPSNSEVDTKLSKLALEGDAELTSQVPEEEKRILRTNSADPEVDDLKHSSRKAQEVDKGSTTKAASDPSPSQEICRNSVPDLDSQPLPDSTSAPASESPKADLEDASPTSLETSPNLAPKQSPKQTSRITSEPDASPLAAPANSSEPCSKKLKGANGPAVEESKKCAHTFENFYSGLVGSLIPGFDEIENQKFSYSKSQAKRDSELEAGTRTTHKEVKATEEAAQELDKGKLIKDDESANDTDALHNATPSSLTDVKKDKSPEAAELSRDKVDHDPKSSQLEESTQKAAGALGTHTSSESSSKNDLVTEPKAVQPTPKDDSNTVYLYMSLASGVRGSMGRFNKASTILKSYDIEFVPIEITLDERAKRLWKLKGVSRNKVLPAVFRDGDMKCDFNELVEANEIEDVEDLIFDGL